MNLISPKLESIYFTCNTRKYVIDYVKTRNFRHFCVFATSGRAGFRIFLNGLSGVLFKIEMGRSGLLERVSELHCTLMD